MEHDTRAGRDPACPVYSSAPPPPRGMDPGRARSERARRNRSSGPRPWITAPPPRHLHRARAAFYRSRSGGGSAPATFRARHHDPAPSKNPRCRPLAGSILSTKDLWPPARSIRSASGRRIRSHPALPPPPGFFGGGASLGERRGRPRGASCIHERQVSQPCPVRSRPFARTRRPPEWTGGLSPRPELATGTPPPKLGEGSPAVARNEQKAGGGEGPRRAATGRRGHPPLHPQGVRGAGRLRRS
jgi:hypothetical protein